MRLVFSFIILLLSFGVFSETNINLKPVDSSYPFSNLTPTKKIERLIYDKMAKELRVSKSEIEKTEIQRIFTSDWFIVNFKSRNYVVDNTASYWLESDLNGMFLLNPSLSKVNVSNSTRVSLMKLMYFLKTSVDYLPTYSRGEGPLNETIFAFVDLTCPYCKEFHLKHRAEWQMLGVNWVYVPFSKDLGNRRNTDLNADVFCQENTEVVKNSVDEIYLMPRSRLTSVASNYKKNCSPVQSAFINFLMSNGERYALAGSPMFLTESGKVFYGAPSLENYIKTKL